MNKKTETTKCDLSENLSNLHRNSTEFIIGKFVTQQINSPEIINNNVNLLFPKNNQIIPTINSNITTNNLISINNNSSTVNNNSNNVNRNVYINNVSANQSNMSNRNQINANFYNQQSKIFKIDQGRKKLFFKIFSALSRKRQNENELESLINNNEKKNAELFNKQKSFVKFNFRRNSVEIRRK